MLYTEGRMVQEISIQQSECPPIVVLQCVAMCCSVLQRVVVCCIVLCTEGRMVEELLIQ